MSVYPSTPKSDSPRSNLQGRWHIIQRHFCTYVPDYALNHSHGPIHNQTHERGAGYRIATAYHVPLAVQTLRARSACSASRAQTREPGQLRAT